MYKLPEEVKIRYDEGLPLLPVSINFSRQGFLYHRPEGLDTILDRLHQDIPIPKWESEKERIAQDNNWK